ncbi:DUF4232 domain-containing protein [Streptomyces roseochromogenus]|uniref:DUF4232 domain-containing protein n=1 Tax=Streptomyces roseochromogenus subsp. oscitans DS 12.976 TaxID=1352936 RepID=V6KBZ6_STRRC|nr:DUF4232 domain-containing protein [Streptomyces roseochromogenus]EST29660.1 hypothetical protein M878_20225 [Streptomyces roseochromogenus subsp. oscitans DS 12.976]
MTRRTAAVSAISLVVALAVAGCGGGSDHVAAQPTTGPSRTTAPPTTTEPSQTPASPSAPAGASRAAACRTEQLRWKLTRLAGTSDKAPAAMLSATNPGTTPCALDGNPDLNVYVGKGPSVSSEPKTTTPIRLVLNHGHEVEFPLFYETSASPRGSCFIPADDDPRIDVRVPHPASGDYGTFVEMSDVHGRHVRAQVCGITIHLGSPRSR